MIIDNKKETDFLFQFLGYKIMIDDLIILFFLYSLYTEGFENTYIFFILILLLFN